jgi:hypothetical protein
MPDLQLAARRVHQSPAGCNARDDLNPIAGSQHRSLHLDAHGPRTPAVGGQVEGRIPQPHPDGTPTVTATLVVDDGTRASVQLGRKILHGNAESNP